MQSQGTFFGIVDCSQQVWGQWCMQGGMTWDKLPLVYFYPPARQPELLDVNLAAQPLKLAEWLVTRLPGSLVEITPQNAMSVLQSTPSADPMVLIIYSSTCKSPLCQNLLELIPEIASEIHKKTPLARVASLDCAQPAETIADGEEQIDEVCVALNKTKTSFQPLLPLN